MRHLFWISIWVTQVAIGQNLVPNPSFEDHSSCPSGGGQLGLAIPWIEIPSNDAEYYDSCSTNQYYDVPNQVYNFQEARTGSAFIGLFAVNNFGANVREYAQAELLAPLQPNICYSVRFFVNRAHGLFGGKYAINNLACSFTSGSVTNTGTGNVLNLPSHIIDFHNEIIVDTVKWKEICGIYQAQGGEDHLTIGVFKFDYEIDTFNVLDSTFPAAYYFIDDVSVIPVDSLPGGMPAFAGNDTTIYYGDTVFIGQEMYGLNCNWYDEQNNQVATNISGIDVSPDSSTFYVVEQILCSNTTYDTVWVTVDTSNIGIENWQNELEVNLYPNPAKEAVNIEIKGSVDELNIHIFDLNGRLVFEEVISKNKGVFSIQPNLDVGVYLLRIELNDHYLVKRLVIE